MSCDIFLGAHGSYYGMEAKYARLKTFVVNLIVNFVELANPFIDREEGAMTTMTCGIMPVPANPSYLSYSFRSLSLWLLGRLLGNWIIGCLGNFSHAYVDDRAKAFREAVRKQKGKIGVME